MKFATADDTVKTLTNKMQTLRVKFDRVAYRKDYDRKYFKQKARCVHCGQLKIKHMMKRHMQTKKCQRARAAATTG